MNWPVRSWHLVKNHWITIGHLCFHEGPKNIPVMPVIHSWYLSLKDIMFEDDLLQCEVATFQLCKSFSYASFTPSHFHSSFSPGTYQPLRHNQSMYKQQRVLLLLTPPPLQHSPKLLRDLRQGPAWNQLMRDIFMLCGTLMFPIKMTCRTFLQFISHYYISHLHISLRVLG